MIPDELRADIRHCADLVWAQAPQNGPIYGKRDEEAAARVLAWLDAPASLTADVRRLCYALLGYGAQEPGELRIMAERLLDAIAEPQPDIEPQYDGVRVASANVDEDESMCWDDAELADVARENAEYLRWVGGE